MEHALEELVRRANCNNLFIGTQGKLPPGPTIVTHLETDEDLEVLADIKDGLEAGTIWPKGRREFGGRATWVAYDVEAIVVLIALMPYLRQAPRSKEINKRICWAGNLLGEWRRQHPDWKSR